MTRGKSINCWSGYALALGYFSERAMWFNEYVNTTQGAYSISIKIREVYNFAPSAPLILNRLRELGYKIKGYGGPNHKKIIESRDIIKELGPERISEMTSKEIMKVAKIKNKFLFYSYIKELKFDFKRIKEGRPGRNKSGL